MRKSSLFICALFGIILIFFTGCDETNNPFGDNEGYYRVTAIAARVMDGAFEYYSDYALVTVKRVNSSAISLSSSSVTLDGASLSVLYSSSDSVVFTRSITYQRNHSYTFIIGTEEGSMTVSCPSPATNYLEIEQPSQNSRIDRSGGLFIRWNYTGTSPQRVYITLTNGLNHFETSLSSSSTIYTIDSSRLAYFSGASVLTVYGCNMSDDFNGPSDENSKAIAGTAHSINININ
jgi:hypothetical protein